MKCCHTSATALHDPEVRGEAVPTITRAHLVQSRCDEAVGDRISIEKAIEIGEVPELQGPDEAVALS
jgi:hypothetical protein